MTHRKKRPKLEIGWREWVALPDLNVPFIRVKVDTGARTSAIHAENIRIYRNPKGQRRVRFTTTAEVRRRGTRTKTMVCRANVVGRRFVTSSNGEREKRWVIRTRVQLGNMTWPMELTLSYREPMKFPMLLGRSALKGKCRIDPQRSFVQGRPKRPRSK